jgi:Ulp1 protease family, C-terminal catalytic domain
MYTIGLDVVCIGLPEFTAPMSSKSLCLAAEESLQIPSNILAFIPSRSWTITQLLDAPLPRLQRGNTKLNLDTTSCFTRIPGGQLSYNAILHIAMPSRPFLLELRSAWGQAYLDGNVALTGLCTITPLPPWLISWWIEICDAVEVQARWKDSQSYLNLGLQGDKFLSQLCHEALTTFHLIQWGEPLRGVAGKELHIHELSALLSQSMLSQSIINGLLLQIREKVERITHLDHPVEICDLNLMDALRKKVDWVAYNMRPEDPNHRWFWRLGNSFHTKKTRHVFLPLYRVPMHWALFWVDLQLGTIQYGDSLKWTPSLEDLELVQRWFSKHSFYLNYKGTFTVGIQMDSISCGIVVLNAIEHALLDKPLWKQSDADLLHVEKYLQLYREHCTVMVCFYRCIL